MIKIRKATKVDAYHIVQFQKNMALETENLVLDDSTINNGVKAVFEDKKKGEYYVATFEDTIIGSFLTTYEWSDWRNGTILWLQSVYVLPEYRGQGVFSAMYDFLRETVEQSPKLRGIRLYVEKENAHAQKVYSKKGMIDHHYDMYEWFKES